MAHYMHLYTGDVDEMMRVLVPSARYRKGHYAYGKFTVPQPHGLHTGPQCGKTRMARENQSASPGLKLSGRTTLLVTYKAHDPETQSMLKALRYWTVPFPRASRRVFSMSC